MSNTSVNPTPVKKPKKQGPVRFGALVPTVIIIALVGAYFKLFFDANLRSAMEWGLTRVHGAEVNVGYVKTSVLGASFETGGLQITDKNQPARNLFEIGRIRFQFLWDALLRAKFVVEDASITGIQALSPRKRPGYVIPPPAPSSEPSALAKIENNVLDQSKEQFNQNILGDLAHVLGGVDPNDQLKNIEGELKSSLRIKELETELKAKEQEWNKRLKEMPQAQEVDELSKKLKALKFNSNNPAEFAASVATAGKLIKEADEKIRKVSEAGKALNQDVNTYNTALKDLEKMVNQDLKDIQARLKIPQVNSAEFTKSLFMKQIESKVASVAKYAAVAKEYMPPKKSPEEKPQPILPPARGEGKNYKFPITKGYPLFWLKKARIQSKVSEDQANSGNLDGEMRDFTTDPQLLGRPAVMTLKGDFPTQKISGLDTKLTLDHTTDQPVQTLVLAIGAYPAEEQKLSDSSDVRFIVKPSHSALNVKAELKGGQIDMLVSNRFESPTYDITAKNEVIQDILQKTMAEISVITLNAKIQGAWDSLKFGLNSNLGEELSKGFQKQIQAKIDEAKAKINALVNEKIGAEKAKLTAEFEKIKSQAMGQVSKAQGEMEKAKKTAEAEIEKQKKSGGVKKLEDEGKKLLKKFKLGG